VKIEDRPAAERPRERLARYGAQVLSLRELIALVLGTGPRGLGCLGLAQTVIERLAPTAGEACPADEEMRFFAAVATAAADAPLAGILGLGAAGSARVLAALELARRFATSRQPPPRGRARSLEDRILRCIPPQARAAPYEWLGFVAVVGGRFTPLQVVARGARTHVGVDPCELFAAILSLRPTAVALAHNHPSGHATPSRADHELTSWVTALLRAFDIPLLGHWIVTDSIARRIEDAAPDA
jgi:DNA repair protein RadC